MNISDNKDLANLLFPGLNNTAEDYFELYPQRNLPEGAKVTRFAPSPTGFVHIGGLFSALISERLAHQSGGVFYLRIEDTDKKREIEGGISGIVNALNNFNIISDEGFISENEQIGNYGSYKQSERINIYHAFIKLLIEQEKAYPCFCTNEELEELRKQQEVSDIRSGYYGEWAVYRNKSIAEIKTELEKGKTFVIRLKSEGKSERKVSYKDVIKGNIEMPENDQDIVICKSDGLPTYHFAHAIDDHLMGTTHVVRGEEWLPSVPVHIQLFQALGWKPPRYAHIPTILKQEGNSKRKLSKRKDPEAAVSFYHEEGFPSETVIEYLLNLANSTFEDWRRNNPEKHHSEFPLKTEKIGSSGALFDLIKLTDISKNVISRMSAQYIYEQLKKWAEKFDPKFLKLIERDSEYTIKILNIDRENKKPRKDIAKWSEIKDIVSYFYSELYPLSANDTYDFPENISNNEVKNILEKYITVFNLTDTKEEWLNRIREFSEELGYAKDTKTYKESPEKYKGYLADTTTVIRIALTKRKQTPDLYEVMKVLDSTEVKRRFNHAINCL